MPFPGELISRAHYTAQGPEAEPDITGVVRKRVWRMIQRDQFSARDTVGYSEPRTYLYCTIEVDWAEE